MIVTWFFYLYFSLWSGVIPWTFLSKCNSPSHPYLPFSALLFHTSYHIFYHNTVSSWSEFHLCKKIVSIWCIYFILLLLLVDCCILWNLSLLVPMSYSPPPPPPLITYPWSIKYYFFCIYPSYFFPYSSRFLSYNSLWGCKTDLSRFLRGLAPSKAYRVYLDVVVIMDTKKNISIYS